MSPHLSLSLRAKLGASCGVPCVSALKSVSARGGGARIQTVHLLPLTSRRAFCSDSNGFSSRCHRADVRCSASQSDASLPAQASTEGAAFKTLQSSLASLDADFFSSLPRDLRVDLEDAVFDLTNGNVSAECGPAVSAALSALTAVLTASQGAPAAAAAAVAGLKDAAAKLPPGGRERAVLGRRLRAAGRRLTGMGAYAQGKAAQLGKAMVAAGEAVAAGCNDDGASKFDAVRTFKLGPLTVDITPSKALTGAAVAAAFAAVSWQLVSGLQAVDESSLAYANDKALTLALSLRGALLAMGYGSCLLSAFAAAGLLALARDLSSQEGGEGK